MSKVKWLALGMLVVACKTESASEYQTAEITASFSALATGNGSTEVSGTLGRGALLTFLQLTADDQLVASQGGEVKAMKEASLLGLVSYSATFGTDAADTELHVKLIRAIDAGAPDSKASLPQPFSLATLAKSDYSRAEAIVVSWTSAASSDPLTLEVTGTCLDSYSADPSPSATSFTIPANALKKHAPASSTETVPDECDAGIRLKRTRAGTVDAAFKGGSFKAAQVRTASFKTKP